MTGWFALGATLLGATQLAAAAPDPVHTLGAGAAKAVANAFQIAASGSGVKSGILGGISVHIGDEPGCYRIRFVPLDDPEKTTIARMGKGGDAGVAGCPDDDAAPDTVLPGADAEAIARVFWAWGTNALDGAPPYEVLSTGAFSIAVTAAGDGVNAAPAGTVSVRIVPAPPLPGECPAHYAYDPNDGSIKKLTVKC
jgi:hypothetical protein